MNTLIRRLALLLAGLMPAFGFAAPETADPDKKLIVFGYETQMPADIATRMHVYEASPFWGMVMGTTVPHEHEFRPGQKTNRFAWLSWGWAMSDADIAEPIRLLASRPASETVTEFFIRLNVCPGKVDWFDDAAWDRLVANNWRLAGKMVREGKLRGVAFDTEQYVTTLFRYEFASRGGQYTWPQCVDMVYRRGQQAMNEGPLCKYQ